MANPLFKVSRRCDNETPKWRLLDGAKLAINRNRTECGTKVVEFVESIDKGDKWYFLYSIRRRQVGCTIAEWAGNAVIHPYTYNFRHMYVCICICSRTKCIRRSCSWSWRLWPLGVNRLRNAAHCEYGTRATNVVGMNKQFMLIYGGIFFLKTFLEHFFKATTHWLGFKFVFRRCLKFGIIMLVKF